MTPPKRIIYFIIVCAITLFCTAVFIDGYIRFQFTFQDFVNNIDQPFVILELFAFLLSITGFISVIYNMRLLKKPEYGQHTELIDNSEVQVHTIGWKYYVHMQFCALIILLGIFLFLFPLQENYPLRKLPNGYGAYLLILVITGLGVLLFKDGIQIKREIESDKTKKHD